MRPPVHAGAADDYRSTRRFLRERQADSPSAPRPLLSIDEMPLAG